MKCECGFEAKTKAGLAAHKRFCQPDKEEFVIVDGDNVVRTYTKEVHGEKAGELAKMFVKKFKNCKIK